MDIGPLHSAITRRMFSDPAGPSISSVEALSTDDMQRLLVLMGTITVISFVLVVSVVTVLIAFIWYTRRRLESLSCGCKGRGAHNLEYGRGYAVPSMLESGRFQAAATTTTTASLHEKEINQHNYYQAVRQKSSLQPPPPGSSLPGPLGGRGFNPRGAPDLRAPAVSSSVIVNPLPPSYNLQPKQNNSSSNSNNSNNNPMVEDVETNAVVDEPIYMEIKPKIDKEAEVVDETQKKEQEKVRNCLEEVKGGRKKEVEYWQITAKEVVKFRPCTETFINRS